MDWYDLHPPWPYNPFKTAVDLKTVEDALKNLNVASLWGILGPVCHEHYVEHIAQYADVDTTWFGEAIKSYSRYVATENPSATTREWQEKMWFRIIKGFQSYFQGKGIKVGSSMEMETLVVGFRDRTFPQGYETYYGEEGFQYIRNQYDFIVGYGYAMNLSDYNQWIKLGLAFIDQYFPKQKKFWIITRPFDEPWCTSWEPEAIALEMKNCLDRNMIILTYSTVSAKGFSFTQHWQWMLKGIELYKGTERYYETYVYGKNLLTGYEGNTYGWVG
jgi:hypothetical protein